MPRALRAFVPYVPCVSRVLRALVPYVLSCFRCLLPYEFSCLMPSVLSCLTCFVLHVHRALCGLIPHALRVLFPYVPYCLAPCVLIFLCFTLLFFCLFAICDFFWNLLKLKQILYSLPAIPWREDQCLSKVWYNSIFWNQIRKHIRMKLQIMLVQVNNVNLKFGIIIIKSYSHRIDEIGTDLSNAFRT